MGSNVIPIAMVTDDNYIMPTSVTIKSLIKNKKPDTIYEIYIITDKVSVDSKKILKTFEVQNVNINIIDYQNKYKDLYNENSYVSNATFIRFDIPDLLKDFDKILYLDVDMIIQKDLTDLYNTNLNDTYAGVVLDIGELFYDLTIRTGLKQYFNAGMILYNAKKYREENLAEKLLEIYKKDSKKLVLMDQDALNIGFNNNITILPPEYNYQQSISEYWNGEVKKYYSLSKNTNIENVSIIHYTRMKPWIYKYVYLKDLWMKYYNLTLYKNEKLNLKSGLLLRVYFHLRAKFKLRAINKILKKIQRKK